MKVAIITRYFLPVKGGIENHCYNLARELLKKGIEVEMHTSKDILTESGILKDYELIDGIKVFRHKDFRKFIPKDYDVIHLHNFNISPHLWIFLKTFLGELLHKKVPILIITPHGGFAPWWEGFSFMGRVFKKFYHKAIGKFFLNNIADKIIAVSGWEREQLIKNGIKVNKIVVIPNGVEDEAYILPKQKDPNLEKKKYLLFIGRISQIKNVDFVIKNLQKIDNVCFFIAGPAHENNYYKYLRNLIGRMELKDRVELLGVVEGKYKYALIDNALALVLTSHNETEPIVVKETIARGKPVIVSSGAAPPYIAEHLENEFIVSNSEEFLKAVKILRENRDLIKKIIEKNKIFSKKWRWDIIASQIVKIYGDSLGEK